METEKLAPKNNDVNRRSDGSDRPQSRSSRGGRSGPRRGDGPLDCGYRGGGGNRDNDWKKNEPKSDSHSSAADGAAMPKAEEAKAPVS